MWHTDFYFMEGFVVKVGKERKKKSVTCDGEKIPLSPLLPGSFSQFPLCLIVYFGRYSAARRLLNLCCGYRGTRLFVFRTGVDFEKFASAATATAATVGNSKWTLY